MLVLALLYLVEDVLYIRVEYATNKRGETLFFIRAADTDGATNPAAALANVHWKFPVFNPAVVTICNPRDPLYTDNANSTGYIYLGVYTQACSRTSLRQAGEILDDMKAMPRGRAGVAFIPVAHAGYRFRQDVLSLAVLHLLLAHQRIEVEYLNVRLEDEPTEETAEADDEAETTFDDN